MTGCCEAAQPLCNACDLDWSCRSCIWLRRLSCCWLCCLHSAETEQRLQYAYRQSLGQRQKVLQGALKACKTVDAVLALVVQYNSSLLNVRLVSAALQRLARCASDHVSALQALHEKPEFQRILSLAQHGTPQMEWRTLVTVARALAKLKCADGTLLAPIEGT